MLVDPLQDLRECSQATNAVLHTHQLPARAVGVVVTILHGTSRLCPDAFVECRLRKSPNQGIAVHQPHRATVKCHVAQEFEEQSRDIKSRNQRPRDIEEMQEFPARADHHAEEGDLPQRRAKPLDLFAEFATVERPRDD